jgi:putative PIN family toxin of toxin-antitoxin system
MAAGNNLRLFLDSNVLISGFFSPNGPPGKILSFHASKRLSIVVCQLIIEEVVSTIREKKPDALRTLQSFLTSAPPEIIKNPPIKEVNHWTAFLHFEDAVILAAAISTEPDYFVTGDNHFYSDAHTSGKSGLRILTPAQMIKILNLQ